MTDDNLTPTALELDDTLDVDAWIEAGRPVVKTHNSSLWWVGDWLTYADRFEGLDAARAHKAIAAAGIPPSTAKVARWVTTAFPPQRRRPRLSVWHHVAVARLHEDQADELLDEAEDIGLTSRELEQRVRRLTGDTETRERPTLLGEPIDVIEAALAAADVDEARDLAERIIAALTTAGWTLVYSKRGAA